MPRLARLVVIGYPHHVTQRGSRRQLTFFDDADYATYIELLTEMKRRTGVEIWAYCLMPNHVHFVAVPPKQNSFARLFGTTHHRYARQINKAHGWQGHLWQERFHSFVMDERHLIATVRYVELNPVRAGLCVQAHDWRWSSVHAHLGDAADDLVSVAPMRELIPDWRCFLAAGDDVELDTLRQHTSTGYPAGDKDFIAKLEASTGRRLRSKKRGRPKKDPP